MMNFTPSPAAVAAPIGMPAPNSVPSTATPIEPPAPAEPFSTQGLLAALAAGDDAADAAGNAADYVPERVDAPEGRNTTGHIRLLEPEVQVAATVPFAAVAGSDGAGAARLRHVLDAFGFAIVSGVLDETDAATAERLFGDDLRSIIIPERCTNAELLQTLLDDPVHRWPTAKLPLGEKFASDYGLPQGKAAWYCRSHPNVKATFGSLFNNVPLCVSMDNVFYNNTPSVVGANAGATSLLWPHADQNVHIKPSGRYECYQGVLYVWPAGADTSATVVWPRSHSLVYPGHMQRGNWKGHFCLLDPTEFADFARNSRRIPVPRGGLLLWNSRTVHQGWPGGSRLAFPICYEPSSRRDDEALASKRQNVLGGYPTTHWASLGHKHSKAHDDSGKPYENDGIVIHHHAHNVCLTPDGGLVSTVADLL